jgi:hypothetical protein
LRSILLIARLYPAPLASGWPKTPTEGRNISGSTLGPLTIASAPADLAAPADAFFSRTEKDPPFGILSCGFTAYGGVSSTHDKAWVY